MKWDRKLTYKEVELTHEIVKALLHERDGTISVEQRAKARDKAVERTNALIAQGTKVSWGHVSDILGWELTSDFTTDVVESEEWDHPPMRDCDCKHCKEYWSDVYGVEPVAYVNLEGWLKEQLWAEDAFSKIQYDGMTALYTLPPDQESLKNALFQAQNSAIDLAKQVEKLELNLAAEPVGEIQVEQMPPPFRGSAVIVHFYNEPPPVGTKLYAAPPKRIWQSIRVDEVERINDYVPVEPKQTRLLRLARELEAKLKEKNGG